MKDIQTISADAVHSERIYFGSPAERRYMWNNLIIEKRISIGWLYKLYEDSIFHDFVLLLTSQVN